MTQWAALPFDPPVEGPSYTAFAKVLLIFFLAAIGVVAVGGESLGSLRESPAEVRWIFALAGAAVLLQCVAILLGRTRIDNAQITQSGLWRKTMRWDEVKSARLLGFPGMSRLMPPRLVLRGVTGRYLIFQGGTTELHRAFAGAVVHVQSRPFREQTAP